MESIPMWSHTTDSSCLSRKPVAPTFTSFQIARNWSSSLGDSYPANNTTQSSGLSQLKIKGQVTSNACKQRNPILISQYDLRYMQVAAVAQQSRLSESNKRYPLTTPLEDQCLKIVNIIANIKGSNKSADNLPKPLPIGQVRVMSYLPRQHFFQALYTESPEVQGKGLLKAQTKAKLQKNKKQTWINSIGMWRCTQLSTSIQSIWVIYNHRIFTWLPLLGVVTAYTVPQTTLPAW